MRRLRGVYLRARSRILVRVLVTVLRPGGVTDLVRLGTVYGGWWVPRSALRPGAVAYCAGVGEDISFDVELVHRELAVTAFDPTPRAIAHVAAHAPTGAFRFEPVGWWSRADRMRFFAPENPQHVSHSVTNLQRTSEYFTAEVAPVHDLMHRLGDTRVDIIKMDIEGAEYEVLASLLAHGPLPTVLCVEFDQPTPVWHTLRAVRMLRASGFDLAMVERWNYTFVRPEQPGASTPAGLRRHRAMPPELPVV